MKIYAPVKDFNGWRNNIRFINGVGETDNQLLIEWFMNRGYRVEKSLEKCEESNEKPLEKCDEDLLNLVIETQTEQIEPDFDKMTPNELREWMRSNGYASKIKGTRNKEKLLDILRG